MQQRTGEVTGTGLALESLSALLNVDWNGIEDRTKRLEELKSAISGLESSLQSFETQHESAQEKVESYRTHLNRYDDLVLEALSGQEELEGLFSQASALQAASAEAHVAESSREEAQRLARKNVERVESLLSSLPAPEPAAELTQAHELLQALDGQLRNPGAPGFGRNGYALHSMRHSA